MKKLSVILLLCLAVLSSCAQKTPLQVSTPVDPNIFYLEELPDIGSFSAIGDSSAPEDFVPSDDYGMVLPFIGSYRVFETPKSEGDDWSIEMGYGSYGFCTPDGRVVMKAGDKNTYLGFRMADDGFGYYTLTREVVPKDDAPDEFTPAETYIIPLDGSWVLKLGASSWVTNVGGGSICIVEYPDGQYNFNESVRLAVYDYDGKLIKYIENVDSYDTSGVYTCGLMMISSWTDNGYTASFINEDGETVLGPYSGATSFNDKAVASVEDENGAYLIKPDGQRLSDYYDSIYREYSNDSKRHVYSARHKDNESTLDIYSDEGEFLGTVEGSSYASFRFLDNGRILYYYTAYDNNDKGYPIYNSERMVWRYLDTGEEFTVDGKMPNSYSGTDNCFIYLDRQNSIMHIFNSDGEAVAEITSADDVINTSEYGEYVIYIEGVYNYDTDPETGLPYPDTRKTHIYDTKNKKIVYTVGSGSNAHFADENKRFILISVYDPTDVFGGLQKSWLFDTKKGEIVLDECDNISYYDLGEKVYFAVAKGNMTALYDGEMNVIRKAYFE